jgi:hypothetical protein
VPAERKGELDAYRWSSHRAYAGLCAKPEWLCLEWLRYWGRTVASARREYRAALRASFGKPATSPWEELRGGLVLGPDGLWEKVKNLVKEKVESEEVRWSERCGARAVQHQVRELVAKEEDNRVRIWARVRLGAERLVDVSQELGYRDGSSVLQVVKRLERQAMKEKALAQTLARLKHELSRVRS